MRRREIWKILIDVEDGICAKDEEREPLHPDGNNKDVKVTATS